jgi:hypothetical protein
MKENTPNVSDNMEGFNEPQINYSQKENCFRRWLVLEIDSGRMSVNEARIKFNLPRRFDVTYRDWQKKYSDDLHLSLSIMSSKDRADNKKLENRIKELEKQLELAKVKNIALETMIDIAETELKVLIRKKPGSKQ